MLTTCLLEVQVAKCRVVIKAAEQQLDDFLPSLRKLLRMPRLEFLSVAGTTHLVEVMDFLLCLAFFFLLPAV
jgi:hypothetical protein